MIKSYINSVEYKSNISLILLESKLFNYSSSMIFFFKTGKAVPVVNIILGSLNVWKALGWIELELEVGQW